MSDVTPEVSQRDGAHSEISAGRREWSQTKLMEKGFLKDTA